MEEMNHEEQNVFGTDIGKKIYYDLMVSKIWYNIKKPC
jgi:hypothetical protein